MNLNSSHSLEVLKDALRIYSGLTFSDPHHCIILKELVERKTNYEISEIAIMRLFDFSKHVFPPSTYTLNILSKYCDSSDWETFIRQVRNNN